MRDLERASGVGRETIRYYIGLGLLPEPARPKPNVADYGEEHVSRLLAKLGVRRLWLSGMTADSCVLATALDANAREFEVRVAPEAVAGLPAAKRRAMALLANSGAAQVERFRMPARG